MVSLSLVMVLVTSFKYVCQTQISLCLPVDGHVAVCGGTGLTEFFRAALLHQSGINSKTH